MGYRPWDQEYKHFEILPEGPFFQPDSILGYKGRPGVFEITLNKQHKFIVSHDANGYRTCSKQQLPDSLPQIWLMGCSFTHGWMLNDSQTFAWKTQLALPHYKLRNFGMSGYGTLHSLIQLEQELKNNISRPEKLILFYSQLHDQRNTANRYWLKAISPTNIMEGITYPFVASDNGTWVRSHTPLTYKGTPLSNHSAFMHFIEIQRGKRNEKKRNSTGATIYLIDQIANTCKQQGIEFILAGITPEDETNKVLTYFEESRNLRTIDISVDMNDPQNSFLPLDPHPSAKANAAFSAKLVNFLHPLPAKATP